MHMQVARNPRPPSASLIDPNVQSLRLKRPLRQCRRTINEFPQLNALLCFVVQKRWASISQRDEQVTVRVRLLVEQDHPSIGPLDDMVLSIKLRHIPVVEQEAPALSPSRGTFTGRVLGTIFLR